METTLVHFKLHVWFGLLFPIYNKHLVVAVIRYLILFDQLFQCNDIGYSLLAEPDMAVVSFHLGLVVYLHGATIACQLHVLVGFVYTVN